MENVVVPIPIDRYEVLVKVDHDRLWSEKGGVLEKPIKCWSLFKMVIKTLLTSFNKDIEML